MVKLQISELKSLFLHSNIILIVVEFNFMIIVVKVNIILISVVILE